MRAAVYQGVDSGLAIETIPDPTPGPREVVIEIERAGICGSDLHMTDGKGIIEAPPGAVLGHEYAGTIVAIGTEVDDVTIGQHVTALAVPCCGRCGPCHEGDLLACVGDEKVMARTGAYAEFMAVGAAATMQVPDGVTSELAALAEPLSVARHGVELAGLRGSERVVVLGAGPIGLGVAYWLRAGGIDDVTVVARTSNREGLARAMGASAFVAAGDGQPEVEKADVVFEAVGYPGSLSDALQVVKQRGTVVGLGFCDEPDPIIPASWVISEVRLQFAMMYSKRDFTVTLDALREHPRDLGGLITATISLDELPSMFTGLRRSNPHGKVLVDPTS